MLILHGFVNIIRPAGVYEASIPAGGGITREVTHARLSVSTDGRWG